MVMLIEMFVYNRIQRQLPQRMWEKNPALQLLQSTTIDEKGTRTMCSLVETLYRWNYFTGWAETKNLFLVFLPPNLRLIIPKRALASEHELDQLRQAFQMNVHEPTGGFPIPPKPVLPLQGPDA
jgi:hypothetical protein